MKIILFWLRTFVFKQYRKSDYRANKDWNFEHIDKLGRIDYSNA